MGRDTETIARDLVFLHESILTDIGYHHIVPIKIDFSSLQPSLVLNDSRNKLPHDVKKALDILRRYGRRNVLRSFRNNYAMNGMLQRNLYLAENILC